MKRVLVLLIVTMIFMVGFNSLVIAGDGAESVQKAGDSISDGSGGDDAGNKIMNDTENASESAEKNTSK